MLTCPAWPACRDPKAAKFLQKVFADPKPKLLGFASKVRSGQSMDDMCQGHVDTASDAAIRETCMPVILSCVNRQSHSSPAARMLD